MTLLRSAYIDLLYGTSKDVVKLKPIVPLGREVGDE
jgi:hypothetical protein